MPRTPDPPQKRLTKVQQALSTFQPRIPPCTRCRRANERCTFDLENGRCVRCNEQKKKCDLIVSFEEFEKLSKAREELYRRAEHAESELEEVERKEEALILAAQERIVKARAHARTLRRSLHSAEVEEDEAYQRELASIGILQGSANLPGSSRAEASGTGSSGTLEAPMGEAMATDDFLDDSHVWDGMGFMSSAWSAQFPNQSHPGAPAPDL